MYKMLSEQLDKDTETLVERLKNARSPYDIDIATINALLIKIIEKVGLDDSEPQRKGRKPGKAGADKASNGATIGSGEDKSGDND